MLGPKCHDFGIVGAGNPDRGVMFIGIAPGKDEVKRGTPFTGPSGKLLNSYLEAVGWSRDDVYCTNLICWFKNDPSPEDIGLCNSRLQSEIRLCKPRLIVTLGKIASEAFYGANNFGRWRGSAQWFDDYNCYVLPTYHPSGILQAHGTTLFADDLYRDLYKLDLILSWPLVIANKQVSWRWANNYYDVQDFFDRLEPGQRVSLDTETGTREDDDAFVGDLLCFAVTAKLDGIETTLVVKPEHATNLKWPMLAGWTYQNGPYDVQVIARNLHVWLPIVDDTLVQSYALDERNGFHGLKPQAREYLGAGYYEEGEVEYVKKGQAGRLADDTLGPYNAADAAYTFRLANRHELEIVKDKVYGVYRRLMIPALNMFADTQFRGINIDYEAMKRIGSQLIEMLLREENELVEYSQELGFDGIINMRSSHQMRHLLFDILGLPVLKRTKGGAPSTDKTVLAELADAHPFMRKLTDFRHLSHTVDAFVVGIDDDIKVDGRVHPSAMLHATRTGRCAYTRPPMAIVLKKGQVKTQLGKLTEQIRKFFIPHNPDTHVIVQADLQRAELWTAYAHSGDEQMLADLQQDFHAATARAIFNLGDILLDEVEDFYRRRSKYVTFGIMFGRQAAALAKGELQCSTHEAQKYVDNWYARYRKYFEWAKARKREAHETGEVVAPFTGRKRRFRLMYGDMVWHMENQAVNFPIQATSHDVMLSAMIELHDTLRRWDSYVLFEVHDAIVFEVSKQHLSTVIDMVRHAMTRPRFEGMCGIPVDIEVGPNWYDLVKV